MNWSLWLLAIISIAMPTAILMLDRAKDLPATRLIKRMGFPALAIFLGVLAYSHLNHDPIFDLLIWGAIGGLLGTVTLDIVRLIGVKLGALPVDMPMVFGLMATGAAPKLPRHLMAHMVATLSEMSDEKRREMMEPRIRAMADLSPGERKLFMSLMMNGINKLPEEKRQRVMKTQIEVLSSLPGEKRAAIMRTMDQLLLGIQPD